ncbi:MAG: hypothetical protein ACFFD2_24635, partial [Promethearchaeota archaeon]
CLSDTLVSNSLVKNNSISEINSYLRKGNDTNQTYLRNKILFASTTNYGLAMPTFHPHRHKTAMVYALRAHKASEKAAELAIKATVDTIFNETINNEYLMAIIPIINRGISEYEKIPIKSPIYVKTEIPIGLEQLLNETGKILELNSHSDLKHEIHYSFYKSEKNSRLLLEGFLPISEFNNNNVALVSLSLKSKEEVSSDKSDTLKATSEILRNEYFSLEFNAKGKIVSFQFENEEFACPSFLDSAVVFGKTGKRKKYSSEEDKILVLRDGSDEFSASIKLITEFEIINNYFVRSEKILTVYSGIKQLFISVNTEFPEIKNEFGDARVSDFVLQKYETKWYEVMPCEIKPNIIGDSMPLRIWKRNFLGYVSYFDLDMREVDRRNANIDCLVSNISDGWMALSNKKKGILVGFNSLLAANFAFSPIKIKDKGFKDVKKKGQQIRINPFGTYYGNMLKHWTDGTGHGQDLVKNTFTTYRSTGPTYNGKTLHFELIIAPYLGDEPPEEIQSFANHFSFPPLILVGRKGEKEIFNSFLKYQKIAENLLNELEIRNIINLSYLEWVKKVNKNYNPSDEEADSINIAAFPKKILLRLLIDGIRGRK